MGSLSGIKVIDLTSVLMGPFATQYLGDFGADVVKVESPAGDMVRSIGPSRSSTMGPLFLNSNRSKRSVVLNLKTPEGRELLLDLCRDADVLVYNVRPAAMKRLGLSWEEVSAVNPRLIYAGLYGYGQKGRYAARPAYDDLIQGGAGLPHLFMLSGADEPRYVPAAIADRIVGLTGLSGILAAIIERNRSGRGQRVDVPMFETMVNLILCDHLGGLTFDPPAGHGGYSRLLAANRRPLKTADGHICALVYTDEQWQRFLAAIGRDDLPQSDTRFASFGARIENVAHVYGWLGEIFLSRTSGGVDRPARCRRCACYGNAYARERAQRSASDGRGLFQPCRASERGAYGAHGQPGRDVGEPGRDHAPRPLAGRAHGGSARGTRCQPRADRPASRSGHRRLGACD